jgi:hypothetical protein
MNAQSEEEKNSINQELKDVYASLSENDKDQFNIQLQKFLVKEYSNIKSVVDGVSTTNS